MVLSNQPIVLTQLLAFGPLFAPYLFPVYSTVLISGSQHHHEKVWDKVPLPRVFITQTRDHSTGVAPNDLIAQINRLF